MTDERHLHEVLSSACAQFGLNTDGTRLLHHYSNAIFLLPTENAVARVTTGGDALARVNRTQAITQWLSSVHSFPTVQPLPGTRPIGIGETTAVSFWDYHPQPTGGPPLNSAHLGNVLRLLHQFGPPPVPLPEWIPLVSLKDTISDPALSVCITHDERAWLHERITEIRTVIAGLQWPLGVGLIHGDAWVGNLLWSPDTPPIGVVLGDWDWVSNGPREVDLIPTWHAASRYGKGQRWVADFVNAYGCDIAQWEGYRVLMAMRDLVQLTGPIRRAQGSHRHFQALRQRLDGLRNADTTTTWTAL